MSLNKRTKKHGECGNAAKGTRNALDDSNDEQINWECKVQRSCWNIYNYVSIKSNYELQINST